MEGAHEITIATECDAWSEVLVESCEIARCEAMICRDEQTLRTLLSEDATWIHSSGQIDSRDEWIGKIRSGEARYLQIERMETRVRLFGDCAISAGVAEMRAVANGAERQLRNRYTNVWVNAAGQPRLVSCQSTKIS